MKRQNFYYLAIVLVVAIFSIPNVNAADLYLNSPLETNYYQSDGTIFAQDGCVIPQAKNVRFLAQSTITLEPGFRVQSGSTFAATIGDYTDVAADADIDADDLPDSWELANFGNISQPRDGDYDGDGHSNFAEYNLETDPVDGNDAPDPDDYDEAVDYGLAAEQQGGGGLVGETVRILNGNVIEIRNDFQFASPHRLGLFFSGIL